MKKILTILLTLSLTSGSVIAEPKVKFYDFDDLLINGEFKKPQVLYIDSDQKIRFERLLKLKKDLVPKLKSTSKDPSLR